MSPLLANIHLHHVLDVWFHGMSKPKRFEEPDLQGAEARNRLGLPHQFAS